MTWTREWGGLGHASMIRLAVLTIWAVTTAMTPYAAYGEFPAGVFEGFGIGRLLLGSAWICEYFLTDIPLTVAKWLTVGACLFGLVLVRYQRVITVLAFVGVIWLDSVTKALGGFANHAQIAPLLTLGVIALLGRPPFLTIGARRPGASMSGVGMHAAVVWLVAVVLVLPYAFIGWQRLLVGGVDMFTGDALLRYFAAASRGLTSYPHWLNVSTLQGWLNAGFFATTLLEASAPLLLVVPAYRRPWLMLMGIFHLSTIWLMNIFFWENLVLLTVVFWWGWRPADARDSRPAHPALSTVHGAPASSTEHPPAQRLRWAGAALSTAATR